MTVLTRTIKSRENYKLISVMFNRWTGLNYNISKEYCPIHVDCGKFAANRNIFY